MFDTRIEICAYSQERDEYNERTDELVPIAVCFAQRTEAGGRENLFASRILHENEIAYTIRWRPGIRPSQYVRVDGQIFNITSVHEEGRRRYLHLKVRKTDSGDAESQG
nr:MAG TPA: head tail joining protein [Caudoviricetes sp.]